MITLQREGITMTVLSDVQVVAFEKNGYVRVADEKPVTPDVPVMNEPVVAEEPVVEKKRGGRQKKTV